MLTTSRIARAAGPRRAGRARWARWALPAVAATMTALVVTPSSRAATATVPDSGVVCASSVEGAASTTKTYQLTASPGHISTPDGNSIYMWGFGNGTDPFQYPGPVLCANEGDKVNVVVHDTLVEPVSLLFPGQSNVTANGAPSQPQLDSNGAIVSMAQPAAANTGSMTYSFVVGKAGTYLYEAGTDQAKQLEMGLFGALIVRPAGHPDWAYGDAGTVFSGEFLEVLTELDPAIHHAVETNAAFDLAKYTPRYFMINGRSFPDTIAPNSAAWLPDQPYSALFHIRANAQGTHKAPYLLRYLNVGRKAHPFHAHGNDGDIIARDGTLLADASGALDRSTFTVNIGPGQTADGLYDWTDVDKFNATTNPVDTLVPLNDNQNLLFKGAETYYSGSPYLGVKDALPVGTTSYNQCGEYYHVMHSHALDEVTNYGAAMGGMLSLERVDPPVGC